MTKYLVLDHVARAYLYPGINTGEKDMFLELSRDKNMIVLKLFRDKIMTLEHTLWSFIFRPNFKSHNFQFPFLVSQPLLL
jgi:hypothetical protein